MPLDDFRQFLNFGELRKGWISVVGICELKTDIVQHSTFALIIATLRFWFLWFLWFFIVIN